MRAVRTFAHLAVASSLLLGAARAQTTWYVDASATPPGLGTLASPFASIQYAHDRPGTLAADILLVAPGTYTENLSLTKQVDVRASGGAEVTRILPLNPGPVVFMNASCDCSSLLPRLDGFEVTGVSGPSGTAAVSCVEGSLRRCLIVGNQGANYVGVGTSWDCRVEFCTIVDNDRGVAAVNLGLLVMLDCVLRNSTSNVSWGVFAPTVNYCAGPGMLQQLGNLAVEPDLWSIAEGDYRLRPSSPCVDTGDPGAPLDPDGTRADMGYAPLDPGHAYGPVTYCTGKLNSQGCVPQIALSGLASATASAPCLVTATLVLPGKRGILFYSALGGTAVPYQGGTLCVRAPFKRAGYQLAQGSGTCGGILSFDFNQRIQSGIDPSLLPGTIVHAQWWCRDRFDPAHFWSGLSNGVAFGIAP